MKKGSWRYMLAHTDVRYIAVFDEDERSIMCLAAPEQTEITPECSDEFVRLRARQMPGSIR